MSRGRIKVAVCVCTYRRPEGLRNLLLGIAQVCFKRIAEPDIEIIVVENDERGSAGSICESLRGILRWPLHYEIEANPGISNARNRCLRIAADHADFIAFLDDDETPTLVWLEELILAQQKYSADVVAGPRCLSAASSAIHDAIPISLL
jgi:glycosyltransferase involved in cell wall biosynthesis